jgi:hypothetical protein
MLQQPEKAAVRICECAEGAPENARWRHSQSHGPEHGCVGGASGVLLQVIEQTAAARREVELAAATVSGMAFEDKFKLITALQPQSLAALVGGCWILYSADKSLLWLVPFAGSKLSNLLGKCPVLLRPAIAFSQRQEFGLHSIPRMHHWVIGETLVFMLQVCYQGRKWPTYCPMPLQSCWSRC